MTPFLSLRLLFLIILFKTLWAQSKIDTCSQQIVKGEYKLKNEFKPKQIVNTGSTTLKAFKVRDTLKIATFRRRVYSKYCYDGGSLDSNTGCTSHTSYVNATKSEIIGYLGAKVCPIGHVCQPYGDCWGSWAERCLTNELSQPNNKMQTTLKWMGDTWTKFAHHTCVQSWECVLHQETVSTYFANSGNSSSVFIQLPTNEVIDVLSDDFSAFGFHDSTGFTHVSLQDVTRKDFTIYNAQCLGARGAGILCQIPNEYEVPHATVYFEEGKSFSNIGNMHYWIDSGKVLFLEDNSVNNIDPRTRIILPYSIVDELHLMSAPSVEDLIKIINSLHFLQLQSIYNTLQLEQELHDVRVKFSRLIQYLMKKDSLLLAEIIEKDIHTTNLDAEVFQVRPCKREHLLLEGNCLGDFIYKDGVLVKRGDKEVCQFYQTSKVGNISLFDVLDINRNLITEGNIGPSAKDDSAWGWLVSFKYEQEQHGDYVQKDTSDLSSIKSDLSGLLNPFSYFSKYFTFVSSCLTWILLIVHCFRR